MSDKQERRRLVGAVCDAVRALGYCHDECVGEKPCYMYMVCKITHDLGMKGVDTRVKETKDD